MPRYRTEAEIDELCESVLRQKDAELAPKGQCLSDDYKAGFRSTFKESYMRAFAKKLGEMEG